MDRDRVSIIVLIFLGVLLAGLVLGVRMGEKQHSGFCPKCNKWYNNQYYYCQDDGEKLLRPAEP